MRLFTRNGRALLLSAAAFMLGCGGDKSTTPGSTPDGGGGSVVYGDPLVYGGQTYKTVKIGGKTWMAENLNYQTEESWCYGEGGQVVIGWDYNYDPIEPIYSTLSSSEIQANCNRYGRLYTWSAAKSACQLIGWRLPTRQEWNDLEMAVGSSAGTKLKATSGWYSNGNGTDQYGFSALPGGRYTGGTFDQAGEYGSWWTAMETIDGNAHSRNVDCYGDNVGGYYGDKNDGLSVRCIAN